MNIKIKVKMMDDCKDLFPVKGHWDDSGFDVKSRINVTIPAGKNVLIPTGVFAQIPHIEGKLYEIQVRPRSGLALKKQISVTNTPGTVDNGYQNEIGVILENRGTEPFEVKRGDRIAQIVPVELPLVELEQVSTFTENTDRGLNGFGSTGV